MKCILSPWIIIRRDEHQLLRVVCAAARADAAAPALLARRRVRALHLRETPRATQPPSLAHRNARRAETPRRHLDAVRLEPRFLFVFGLFDVITTRLSLSLSVDPTLAPMCHTASSGGWVASASACAR